MLTNPHQRQCLSSHAAPSSRPQSRQAGNRRLWPASIGLLPLQNDLSSRKRGNELSNRQGLHICRASVGSQSSNPGGLSRLAGFVSDQFLPLALLTGMVTGLASYLSFSSTHLILLSIHTRSVTRACPCRFLFPGPGQAAANAGLQNFTTTGIFIISGLCLRRGDTLQALSAWGSVLFGLSSILFITPMAALLALQLPLYPSELAFGLAVFCCMPTTLSSGVSLTQVGLPLQILPTLL